MLLEHRIHYKAQFEVRAEGPSRHPWDSVLEAIRSWLQPKLGKEMKTSAPWFERHGEWVARDNPRLRIQVHSTGVGASEPLRRLWAVRCEHPCSAASARQWRIDIALEEQENGSPRVSICILHCLIPGFIGQEPAPPSPSAPSVLARLLGVPGLVLASGGDQVTAKPIPIPLGGGRWLLDRLIAEDRLLPIIAVSRARAEGETLVQSAELARLVAGAALVVEFASSESALEMSWLLPRTLRCFDGMVRVYQPRVALENPEDERRHRFFTRQEIADRGPGEIEHLLVASIHRWGKTAGSRIIDIDEVYGEDRKKQAEDRRRQLEQLRAKLLGPDSQVVAGLRTHFGPLDASLVDDLVAMVEEDGRIRELYESEKAAREAAERQTKVHLATIELLRKKRAEDLVRLAAVGELRDIPASPAEAVSLAERVFSGRLAFSARARESMSRSAFKDTAVFWRCLWAMNETLHPLFFEADEACDIEARFSEASEFELAMTEKGSTKKDASLVRLREDEYNGKRFEAWAHIKWGREPKMLRIYFFPDREEKLLIVSHCGDHLQTAGTGRRK